MVDEPFALNVKVEDGSPMKTKTNVECSFVECLKCDLKIDGILMMYLTLQCHVKDEVSYRRWVVKIDFRTLIAPRP